MRTLTIGKLRGLQRCSTAGQSVAVLALDHRNNLRKALSPTSPETVTAVEMSAFKQELVSQVAPEASAVLLDPEVGAAQCIRAAAVPSGTGLIVAVEATGYAGSAAERESRILEGWSVEKARRAGADAVKLLVYYHPDSPAAGGIVDLVAQVAEECSRHDVLFMLEPLSYSVDPESRKVTGKERRRVVIETARNLTIEGVDVLKAEFPLDISAEPAEESWAEACAELSGICPVPWVLLSAGVTYETYLRQVVVACEAGCSGVAAGRAVWAEAVGLDSGVRREFLETVACRRMGRLRSACDALARPVTEFFVPEAVSETWYLGK